MQTPSAIQPSLLATTWIRFKQAPPQDHGLSMVDDDWSAVLGSFSHAKGVQLCVILGRFEILHKRNDDQLMMIKNKRPVNPTPFSGTITWEPPWEKGESSTHRFQKIPLGAWSVSFQIPCEAPRFHCDQKAARTDWRLCPAEEWKGHEAILNHREFGGFTWPASNTWQYHTFKTQLLETKANSVSYL